MKQSVEQLPFHVILFAIYPVLFLVAHNQGQVVTRTIWLPLAIIVGCSLFLLLVSRLLCGNLRKAALITSFLLLLFFSYGHVYQFTRGILHELQIGSMVIGRNKMLTGVWCVLFVLGVFWLSRAADKTVVALTKACNLIMICLVAFVLINIGFTALKSGSFRTQHSSTQGDLGAENPQYSVFFPTNAISKADLPNIYYIILDEFARADILKEVHDLDASDFLHYLEEKGFYVAGKSRSNYVATYPSLVSSLNMSLIQDIIEDTKSDAEMYQWCHRRAAHSQVFAIVKQHGYRLVAFPTDISWTEMKHADVYLSGVWAYFLDDFQQELLQTTPVPAIQSLLGISAFDAKRRRTVLNAFDQLENSVTLDGPLFVFSHIMSPHSPFVFDANGRIADSGREGEWTERFDLGFRSYDPSQFFLHDVETRRKITRGYREQVKFVNQKLRAAIDVILTRSKRPTLILIQGDHGSRMLTDWENIDRTHLKELLSIFSAYYFHDSEYSKLYPEISPVNSFRVIFNQYFGASFPLLEDRSYFNTATKPFEFVDVTDRVDSQVWTTIVPATQSTQR